MQLICGHVFHNQAIPYLLVNGGLNRIFSYFSHFKLVYWINHNKNTITASDPSSFFNIAKKTATLKNTEAFYRM